MKAQTMNVHCLKPRLGSSLLGLALCALSVNAAALDLAGAYAAALTRDASIRASRASADSGRERLPQALSQLLPNFSASASRNNNRLLSTNLDFTGNLVTVPNQYVSANKTFTLRQPLYRPYNAAQYQQAKAQVEDTEATLRKDLQNLAVRLSGAYFEALLSEDQLELLGAQREFFVSQLDGARKAFAAGSGIRTDIDEAQARLDMVLAQELEARQGLTYNRRQLQAIVDQPIDRLAKLDKQRLPLVDLVPGRSEDWTDLADLNSPEIISSRAQVEAARQEVEKAKAGHKPTLDAIAQWSRSSSENLINISSSYDTKSFGVQLQVPIFAGGYVNSQVRQALAELERSEQALEALRRDLGIRVYAQFRAVTEGVLKVRALEQAARSSDQLVTSARRAFQAGSRTRLDILNAEQQKMSVLRDLAQARYMYVVGRIHLDALVGNDMLPSVQEVNGWLMP